MGSSLNYGAELENSGPFQAPSFKVAVLFLGLKMGPNLQNYPNTNDPKTTTHTLVYIAP